MEAPVDTDPFPHLNLPQALDDDIVAAMDHRFPDFRLAFPQAFAASNVRLTLHAADLESRPEIDSLWKAFCRFHTSAEFFRGFVARFSDHAPDLARLGAVGVKGVDDFSSHEVLLNCMLCVNTPVTVPGPAVRRGHVDLPNKLYTALFYLRAPNDDSVGGALELYRFARPAKDGRARQPADALGRSEIDPDRLTVARSAPYAANRFVLFANRPDAAHGVTPRSVTPFPRRFVCLTAEVAHDRFQLSRAQTTR